VLDDLRVISDEDRRQDSEKSVYDLKNRAEVSLLGAGAQDYFVAITALCGPASGTTRASENPASFIQPMQSAPVKSKPPAP
jgi:hypothetical protein